MSKNPIEQVREAELKAEELLNEAVCEAARIKKDAETQGKLKADNSERASRAAAAALIESAHKRADKSFREAAEELEEQTLALRRKASERHARAVEAILASIN